MSYKLGLTGSIGMGKSTTAAMFGEHGIPVWDADAAVHELYDGAAVGPVGAAFPEAIVAGKVSRAALKQIVQRDDAALGQLEAIVHPLVAAHRASFLDQTDSDIVLFDIPLLYETGAEGWLDGVAVVSAPEEIQTARVLARPGMSQAMLDTIRARQMPDAEKRARAVFIIETITLDGARAAVSDIISKIRHERAQANA